MNQMENLEIKTRSERINVLRAFGCIAIVAWHVYANVDFQIKTNGQR